MTAMLAGVFSAPSSANAHIVRAISAAFALALILLGFVGYRSSYSPEPAVLTDVVVHVSAIDTLGSLQLTETRRFTGKYGESMGVQRHLFQDGDATKTIALEGGLFSTSKGQFTASNIMLLPSTISGRWCLKTSYTWWPAWSQREFQMDTPDICFETTQNG